MVLWSNFTCSRSCWHTKDAHKTETTVQNPNLDTCTQVLHICCITSWVPSQWCVFISAFHHSKTAQFNLCPRPHHRLKLVLDERQNPSHTAASCGKKEQNKNCNNNDQSETPMFYLVKKGGREWWWWYYKVPSEFQLRLEDVRKCPGYYLSGHVFLAERASCRS